MLLRHLKTFSYVLFFSFVFGCGESERIPMNSSDQAPAAGMKLNITNQDNLDGVTTAEVMVTASDIVPIRASLNVSAGVISGSIPQIPVGTDRLFKIQGYDANGLLIVTGQTTTNVVSGQALVLNIDITKVGQNSAQSKFVSAININPLTGGSGRIEFMKIPAGSFVMGSDSGNPNERPVHNVYLGDYYIGKHEITVEQFIPFLNYLQYIATEKNEYGVALVPVEYAMRRGGDGLYLNGPIRIDDWGFSSNSHPQVDFDRAGPSPTLTWIKKVYDGGLNYGDQPITQVPWRIAFRYCEWLGGRLPTEAEWEKAARSNDRRTFPWGNDFSEGQAAVGLTWFGSSVPPWDTHVIYKAVVIGDYLGDISPYGVYDMAGSVSEWTKDIYDAAYYYSSDYENPQGPNRIIDNNRHTRFVVRGGNIYQDYFHARTTYRATVETTDWNRIIGFRCVTD